MTGHRRRPVRRDEKRETVIQVGSDLLDAEHASAGAGKLDRQRDAIEAAADRDDGLGVVRRQGEAR